MTISESAIFVKMESCLKQAKTAQGHEAREHIRALQALCDLVLNKNDSKKVSLQTDKEAVKIQAVQPSSSNANSQALPSKRLEMEDGANGNSIFDF